MAPELVTRDEVKTLVDSMEELQSAVVALGAMYTESAEKVEAAETQARVAAVAVTVATQARRRLVIWGLVLLMFSTCVTIAMIGTITSRCFIDIPRDGFYRASCDLIPGYSGAIAQQDREVGKFGDALAAIQQDEQRLKVIEATLKRVERATR